MAAHPKKDDETTEDVLAPKPAHQGAGRPNDTPIVKPVYPNSTLASRQAERAKRTDASNKRVAAGDTDTK